MIIRPGCIVPINYELWSAKSDHMVLAMVMTCEDQWFNLCPVSCEPQLAGFNDLVVLPDDCSLNTFMVIMGKMVAGFPAGAISPEVFAGSEAPCIKALKIPDCDCDRLCNAAFTAASNGIPGDSCKINRGNFIVPGSPAARKAANLASEWISFAESAWRHEFSSRHLSSEINVKGIIDELMKPLHGAIMDMERPPKPQRITRPKGIGGRSLMHSNAGRIGSLPGFDITDEPSLPFIENLRKELSAGLIGSSFDNPSARNLLKGTIHDLLKLILLIFPRIG